MKKRQIVSLFMALAVSASAGTACLCGVAPERADDFFWENDKVGFRAYGPRDYHRWSGIDVFNKGHAENEVMKLLRGGKACGAWHNLATLKGGVRTFDNYVIGAGRGVGGVALYGDGEWKTYPNWESSEVLHTGDDYLQFKLVYPAFSAAGKMTYLVTMRRGERFFRNDVSFERMPKGFLAGPALDLEPNRQHKGVLVEEPGLVSLFEDAKADAQGNDEGSTMTAVFVDDPSQATPMTDHMNCRVLAFKGRKSFTYWAGAGWSGAGEITTPAVWLAYVKKFMSEKSGVSKNRYLDLMEAAVSAYSDAHIAAYLADVERDGVQEHGFPRLVANIGVLVANGRALDRRALLKRMMEVACRDAKRPMPPKSGGNDFSVKELSIALAALERAKVYPKDVTDAWRAALCAVEAETAYMYGRLRVGERRAHNWVVFASASEQARRAYGYGGNAAFVEKYVADQMRWFDANGMYKDPNQPAVYDFVTRLQFAAILWFGFDGPSRAGLESLMDISAEPTLKMLSAAGEIPYGGRSNQFLHNNTFYAALCEWYAAWAASRGDRARAAEFRHAARMAIDAMSPWLAEIPVSHVKNRYPLALDKGVYSEQGDMGCERYAYFDKYMVTMGSWAMLGWLFADESIAADAPVRPPVETFVTTPDFHFVFLRAGDYSAQFDYNADTHYDCDGLGRLHRAGAPTALCLSVPCAEKPNYRIERPNDAPLAIAPAVPDGTPHVLVRAEARGDVAEADWKVGALDWRVRLADKGLAMTLSGSDAVALTLPAFQFDGREETRIDATAKSLSVAYHDWRCVYELTSEGEITDTGRVAANRNGRYRRFEARGAGRLSVHVSIEKEGAK